MKHPSICGLLATLLLTSLALADDNATPAEWSVLAGRDGAAVTTDNTAYYCGAKAMKVTSDGTVRIWLKEELAGAPEAQASLREQKISFRERRGQNTEGWDQYSHALQLYEFDCRNGQFRVLEVKYCRADGSLLDAVQMASPQWARCTAGTTCSAVLEACCGLSASGSD